MLSPTDASNLGSVIVASLLDILLYMNMKSNAIIEKNLMNNDFISFIEQYSSNIENYSCNCWGKQFTAVSSNVLSHSESSASNSLLAMTASLNVL